MCTRLKETWRFFWRRLLWGVTEKLQRWKCRCFKVGLGQVSFGRINGTGNAEGLVCLWTVLSALSVKESRRETCLREVDCSIVFRKAPLSNRSNFITWNTRCCLAQLTWAKTRRFSWRADLSASTQTFLFLPRGVRLCVAAPGAVLSSW